MSVSKCNACEKGHTRSHLQACRQRTKYSSQLPESPTVRIWAYAALRCAPRLFHAPCMPEHVPHRLTPQLSMPQCATPAPLPNERAQAPPTLSNQAWFSRTSHLNHPARKDEHQLLASKDKHHLPASQDKHHHHHPASKQRPAPPPSKIIQASPPKPGAQPSSTAEQEKNHSTCLPHRRGASVHSTPLMGHAHG